MSAFFGHVADAALPVAVALLVLTAVARGVLWAGIEGDERRIARRHLEPLATWCLIAAGAYAFAICAAGKAGVLPLAAALLLALAAVLMRSDKTETAAVRAEEPKPAPVRTEEPKPHGRTPAPAASLWDEPTENAKPTGLWAR